MLPIHYRRVKIALCGDWTHRATGKKFSITPGRADEWIKNTTALSATGIKPFLPPLHIPSLGSATNYGYVEGLTRKDDGIYADLALFGDEGLKAAATNSRSVYVVKDARDASGKKYPGETIAHVALVPNPALPDLGGFVKLAASASGPAFNVPVLTLATTSTGAIMPLSDAQREALKTLGAGEDVNESNAFDWALSRAAYAAQQQYEAELALSAINDANKANEAKVLELSAYAPTPRDPMVVSMAADNIAAKRELAIQAGLPEAGAKLIDKLVTDSAGQPNVLALSAAGEKNRPFAFELWDVISKVMGMDPREDRNPAVPQPVSGDRAFLEQR